MNLEGRFCSRNSSVFGAISFNLWNQQYGPCRQGLFLSLTESVNINGLLCFFASCVITNYITVVCVGGSAYKEAGSSTSI